MKDIYTAANWELDGTFAAKPGQEITGDIYETFYNQLPPLYLPRASYPVPVTAGFMSSEPYTHADSSGKFRAFYLAFGSCGDRYYYLGLYATNGDAIEDARPLPVV